MLISTVAPAAASTIHCQRLSPTAFSLKTKCYSLLLCVIAFYILLRLYKSFFIFVKLYLKFDIFYFCRLLTFYSFSFSHHFIHKQCSCNRCVKGFCSSRHWYFHKLISKTGQFLTKTICFITYKYNSTL